MKIQLQNSSVSSTLHLKVRWSLFVFTLIQFFVLSLHDTWGAKGFIRFDMVNTRDAAILLCAASALLLNKPWTYLLALITSGFLSLELFHRINGYLEFTLTYLPQHAMQFITAIAMFFCSGVYFLRYLLNENAPLFRGQFVKILGVMEQVTLKVALLLPVAVLFAGLVNYYYFRKAEHLSYRSQDDSTGLQFSAVCKFGGDGYYTHIMIVDPSGQEISRSRLLEADMYLSRCLNDDFNRISAITLDADNNKLIVRFVGPDRGPMWIPLPTRK